MMTTWTAACTLPARLSDSMSRARRLERQRKAAKILAERYHGSVRVWARHVAVLDMPPAGRCFTVSRSGRHEHGEKTKRKKGN